jgi:hypothetical protein
MFDSLKNIGKTIGHKTMNMGRNTKQQLMTDYESTQIKKVRDLIEAEMVPGSNKDKQYIKYGKRYNQMGIPRYYPKYLIPKVSDHGHPYFGHKTFENAPDKGYFMKFGGLPNEKSRIFLNTLDEQEALETDISEYNIRLLHETMPEYKKIMANKAPESQQSAGKKRRTKKRKSMKKKQRKTKRRKSLKKRKSRKN